MHSFLGFVSSKILYHNRGRFSGEILVFQVFLCSFMRSWGRSSFGGVLFPALFGGFGAGEIIRSKLVDSEQWTVDSGKWKM